jgi:metal-dependent hydrolase (beta-lactamase superfamily II)
MSFNGVLPKIPISIDDFLNIKGVEHYFISHFHSDHYPGLQFITENQLLPKKFIFCSEITKKFIIKSYKKIPSEKIVKSKIL